MIFPKVERTLDGRYCVYNGYIERFCGFIAVPVVWTLMTVRVIR